jgi:collagenase-like PrtC family protease
MTMKISLAAVPYFWSRESYQSFYEQLAKSAVGIVYLGETVCSKRRSMKYQDWLDIAAMLTQAGKQVVLSTLTLLEAESELRYLSRIAAQNEYLVEANDMAAAQVAHEHGNPFVVGCAINVYNNRALSRLKSLGMMRWCVPVELGQRDLQPMLPHVHDLGLEVEYQVFGRMPLAYSARCFTARHYNLARDDCQFKCLDDEQGMCVHTQEGEAFAQINGIQIQSARVTNLLHHWQDLQSAGIDILRVVPVGSADTLHIIGTLDAIIKGQQEASIPQSLNEQYEFCDGYWLQQEGMRNSVAQDSGF